MAPKRRRRHSTRLTGSTRPATCAPARSTRSTWRACSRSAPFCKRQGRPKESSKGSGEAGALAPACLVLFVSVSAPATIEDVEQRLRERRYIGDRALATSIFLALKLQKPLFIEGEAGVGKTEAAKVMAEVLGARLIRLQCYEGIDLAHAVYEWNYPRQLLHIRLMGEGEDRRAAEREIFSSEFLLRRAGRDADRPKPRQRDHGRGAEVPGGPGAGARAGASPGREGAACMRGLGSTSSRVSAPSRDCSTTPDWRPVRVA